MNITPSDLEPMTTSQLYSVLVVDDHAMIRHGLKALVQQSNLFMWVGEAASAEDGVQQANSLAPDLVVMDLQLDAADAHKTGGIEATRRIRAALPNTRILVFTMHEDADTVFRAVQAGAHGYLLKGTALEETLAAMQTVVQGGVLLPPALAQAIHAKSERSPTAAADAFHELTDKQHELLTWLAKGKNYKEIAQLMGLSPRTVRNYASNIFALIHAEDKVQAALMAQQRGL